MHNQTPAWLEDESMHNASAPLSPRSNSSSSSSSGSGGGSGGGGTNTKTSMDPASGNDFIVGSLLTPTIVRHILKAMTMLLCVLMFVTACVGIQTIQGANQAGKVFVATYMLFFSVLLFLFEAIQIRKIEWLDFMFQRNFGFLYSVIGKAFFVIFIAFLSFGLGDPEGLTMATGLSMSCFGGAQVALFLKYPEFFEDEMQQIQTRNAAMGNAASV